MKFSDIRREDWQALHPYLDTCLLPLTGLTGQEEPWQVTDALERLRDVMDMVEIPYKGRIVTYPASHYGNDDSKAYAESANKLCRNLKKCGFKYVIAIAFDELVGELELQEADLFIRPQMWQNEEHDAPGKVVSKHVEALWKSGK